MKLKEIINEIIPSRYRFVNRTLPITTAFETINRAFADMVWLNCCELLTDLCDDVVLTFTNSANAPIYLLKHGILPLTSSIEL